MSVCVSENMGDATTEEGVYLTLDEMNAEVLDCARYGEHEELRDLIVAGADVNHCDDGGSNALHKAAANNEVECMKVLKEFAIAYKANEGGNFPTHWAAQNGQLDAMNFLIDNFGGEVDMLAQNKLGKSTLTEAFNKGDEHVLEVVLKHDSANEEKLLQTNTSNGVNRTVEGQAEGGVTVFTSTNDASTDAAATTSADSAGAMAEFNESNAVTHMMDLANDKSVLLKIRELPITNSDNPFGTDTAPEDDSTGLAVWPASIICARYTAINEEYKDMMRGKVVMELGAGAGLPGIAAALHAQPRKMYITDIHQRTLVNAAYNIVLNRNQDTSHTSLPSLSTMERAKATIGASDDNVKDDDSFDYASLIDNEEVTVVLGEHCETSVRNVNWLNTETFPPEKADVILGSDLVYDSGILAILSTAVDALLNAGGSFLYVAPDDGRDGMDELVNALEQKGLRCINKKSCEEEVYANPLAKHSRVGPSTGEDNSSADEDLGDDFVLHFYDMARKQPHSCYHFVKE